MRSTGSPETAEVHGTTPTESPSGAGTPTPPGTRSTGSPEAARDGKRGAPCNISSTSLVEHFSLATCSCSSFSTPTTPAVLRIDYQRSPRARLRPLPGVRVDKLKQSSVTPLPRYSSRSSCRVLRVRVQVYWPGGGVYACSRLHPRFSTAAPCPSLLWLTSVTTKIRRRDTSDPSWRAAVADRVLQRLLALRRPLGRMAVGAPRH